MRTLLLAALLTFVAGTCLAEGAGKGPEGSEETGVDIVVLWDGPAVSPPDPGILGAFLGTVRQSDRFAVAAVGEPTTIVLPIQPFSGGGALSAAYQTSSGLRGSSGDRDLGEGLGVAMRYLDFQRRPGAMRAIIVVSGGTAAGCGSDDAGPSAVGDDVLSRLLMGEIAVFSLSVSSKPCDEMAALVSGSGGKAISLNGDGGVVDGLSLVYDSLQLRARVLSVQREEGDGGPLDYRYLDEKVETPDEGVEADARAKEAVVTSGSAGPLVIALLAVIILLNLAAIGLALLRGRARSVQKTTPDAPGSHRVNESPSFSRLTMGLNRFRGSFSDAESRLEALSLDLEDYGAESWDMEKKLMDEYVSLAQKVFLQVDHMGVAPGSADGGARVALGRKLVRLLEDSGIDPVEAEVGAAMDGRYHVQAGVRESEMPPGSIVEVVRKGYVKREGLVHGEPIVLRKAEVIVSGRAAGAASEGGDE